MTHYNYSLTCNCGTTEIDLHLSVDNMFTIKFYDRWMGKNKLVINFSGTYKNTGNNYYTLYIDNIYNKNKSISIDLCEKIIIEFVTLTSPQLLDINNLSDENVVCLYMAGDALFNHSHNEDECGKFDSIFTFQKESIIKYFSKKSEIIELLEGHDFEAILSSLLRSKLRKIK